MNMITENNGASFNASPDKSVISSRSLTKRNLVSDGNKHHAREDASQARSITPIVGRDSIPVAELKPVSVAKPALQNTVFDIKAALVPAPSIGKIVQLIDEAVFIGLAMALGKNGGLNAVPDPVLEPLVVAAIDGCGASKMVIEWLDRRTKAGFQNSSLQEDLCFEPAEYLCLDASSQIAARGEYVAAEMSKTPIAQSRATKNTRHSSNEFKAAILSIEGGQNA